MKKNRVIEKIVTEESTLNDPGNLLLLIYLGVIVFFLLLGSLTQASAQNSGAERGAEPGEPRAIEDVNGGELLISHGMDGTLRSAPLLSQKVNMSVSGMVVNTVVKQRFNNTSDDWVEAVYVFPLPDESAVKGLRMIVGERVIVGRIKEKKEARATYEQAKSEGKKTSLLSQKRPNIFTMAVANIPPKSVVEVEIEYLDTVRYRDGIFSLRFPLVVGPRYISGSPKPLAEKHIAFDGKGWSNDTDQVEDASEITPQVVKPSKPKQNPVQLQISLAPGFPVKDISSPYHGIDIADDSMGSYEIGFDGKVFADRDFVLEYRAANARQVSAALFQETTVDGHYTYLMLTPPFEKRDNRVPRDLLFVLDISGSMAGSSMRQAKEALIYSLSRLYQHDRFNIIVFNNTARKLYTTPLDATAENVEKARKDIIKLEATGGTEISSALALALDGRSDHERIRQVVFLTDGAVGNETALFSMIRQKLGDARLFTIGIGSAPNSYFMSRAATMGRGSYSHIGRVEEVSNKMRRLLEKLEQPVVTGLRLENIGGEQMEMYPSPLPDVYMGEPVVALIKSDKPLQNMRLSGMSMGKPWTIGLGAKDGKPRPGIATVWARKKIRTLMESLYFGETEEKVRSEVLKTALTHQLISKYTSLVAVEDAVSRPQGSNLENRQVRTNMPKGWQHNKVFGTSSQTATNSELLLVGGLLMMILGVLLRARNWRLK